MKVVHFDTRWQARATEGRPRDVLWCEANMVDMKQTPAFSPEVFTSSCWKRRGRQHGLPAPRGLFGPLESTSVTQVLHVLSVDPALSHSWNSKAVWHSHSPSTAAGAACVAVQGIGPDDVLTKHGMHILSALCCSCYGCGPGHPVD